MNLNYPEIEFFLEITLSFFSKILEFEFFFPWVFFENAEILSLAYVQFPQTPGVPSPGFFFVEKCWHLEAKKQTFSKEHTGYVSALYPILPNFTIPPTGLIVLGDQPSLGISSPTGPALT